MVLYNNMKHGEKEISVVESIHADELQYTRTPQI